MRVLGFSAFHHDSAAALVEDGRIVAAVEEERFSRRKHDSGFPRNAIAYCLAAGGCGIDGIDLIASADRPAAGDPVFRELGGLIPGREQADRVWFGAHHLSHAASAFFPSPFPRAAVLTMDGIGRGIVTALALGDGNRLEMIEEVPHPHSLGLLYSAFTRYAGFKPQSGEYKVMGLAPYGRPRFTDRIFEMLDGLSEDGTFRLDEAALSDQHIAHLLGRPARHSAQPLDQFHMDVAASIQRVTEQLVLRLARAAARRTGASDLCMAGGVALNCVANGKLLREGVFERLWIQPAAGDAGGAIGAALAAYHMALGGIRRADDRHDRMDGGYLGPAYTQQDVERRLAAAGAVYLTVDEDGVTGRTAAALAAGKTVGWMQGRLEFGPRALGNRSILADPRRPTMRETLNRDVKFREPFRPFAPAVLAEDAAQWFELPVASPYMLLVAPVRRSEIPAATHVDGSARPQTVDAETNPRFHALLSRFKELTGCPVLLNTSFNVRGEPMVNTPEDAFRCFMGSDIDLLAVGNCLLRKEEQDIGLRLDYRTAFDPD